MRQFRIFHEVSQKSDMEIQTNSSNESHRNEKYKKYKFSKIK
jgi:hypothetical protein